MALGNNSFTTVSNIRFGSAEMMKIWWNVQEINLPSMTFQGPNIGGRAGAQINLASDSVDYGELTLSVILDKDWKVYDEIYDYFLEGLNVETGKFSHYKKFELWVEFVDGKGQVKRRFWFHDCRLSSFDGLLVTTKEDEDSNQVMSLTFDYLYYTHIDPPNMDEFKLPEIG